MSAFLTPEQLKQRTARAADAATLEGQRLGLTVTDPQVVHDLFSVVVHLKPSDVVARVPVVLPRERRDPESVRDRQRIELSVVDWLAKKSVPIVPPSPAVPLEPVATDEFSITFWQHVDVEADAELDVVANAPAVARLHQWLRDYPQPLPYLTQMSWVSQALAFLEAKPDIVAADDLDRAQREWKKLGPIVESPQSLTERFGDIGMQPLHGDAPAVNMLATKTGKLYSDFEDPVWGPIEVDLALNGPEAVASYDEAAQQLGMRTVNPEVLALFEAVALVQTVACFAFVPDLPVLAQYLEHSLPQWRQGPFAGGVV